MLLQVASLFFEKHWMSLCLCEAEDIRKISTFFLLSLL